MEQFIDALEWRYAAKKYDNTKKVPQQDLDFLKKAVQLSVSSIGLQPYKVFVIESQEIRDKLKAGASGNNANIFGDASHIFIFANELDFGQQHINKAVNNMAAVRNQKPEDLQGFNDYISGYVNSLSRETRDTWTAKQTYIAMGNLITAAALLKIDATPMEGFDPAKINEILSLEAQGLNAALIATVGYRHADDEAQHYKKVRKQNEDLFITL